MSDKFSIVNGYVSATTAIVNSWFLLPKKTIEIADNPVANVNWIEKPSCIIKIFSLVTTYTYQYHKYIKAKPLAKWPIYGLIIAHIIALILIYLYLLEANFQNKISGFVSKYLLKGCLPILAVIVGTYHIYDMLEDCDNASAYRILNAINAYLGLADFLPIHELMKLQPEIYYSVHGIRVALKNAEGATLLVEVSGELHGINEPALT